MAKKGTKNGATAPQGPQIQRRTAWLDLPVEYAGFRVLVWLNAPTSYWTSLTSQDEKTAVAAMQKIVLEHNGWLDFDGQPYPPASDPELWEQVPTELAACVLAATQAQIQTLPNSLLPRRRN